MPELPLMPMPAHLEQHDGALVIDESFRVALCTGKDAALERSIARFATRLSAETGILMLKATAPGDCAASTLAIETKKALSAPALGDDESYRLEVTPQAAHLTAPTATGVLRGLATFEQLVQAGSTSFSVASVTVDDRPRFPWRGFMLDASRHWMPVEVVERNLDAMAAVKLNVFHWHLSDDQGFRVESLVYPKLQGRGSDGHYYTQQQVRQVVAYARDLGIRVIPEFDMPGHTTSWLVGYPELASAQGTYDIGRKWGVYETVMNPALEWTYLFLDRLIREMAGLFPDAYFHIGGDEVKPTQWMANSQVQRFMQAHSLTTAVQLHGYFNKRLQALVAKHGKTMIGWDEILTPDLDKGAVIQSWRGQAGLADAARQGHKAILSYGYYLDHMRTAEYHYANDPLGADSKTLGSEESARILGGEACMWTEYVNAETVDSRSWPRLAVIAERFWSPASVTDVGSMYTRLEPVNRKLTWTGIEHLSAQPLILSRMTDDYRLPALKTLVDAVEALGLSDRYKSRSYSSLVPLNRLVDAAFAESETVRHLTADAHAVAAGHNSHPDASLRLREAFHDWHDLPAQLASMPSPTFLVSEVLPAAESVAKVSDVALQCMNYIDSGQVPPDGWAAQQRTVLDAAAQPVNEVRIAAERVARVLLDAISGPPAPSAPLSNGSAAPSGR